VTLEVHWSSLSIVEMLKQKRGRPKKYGRPSRAVTVTLPEDVLAQLDSIDTDRGRAIVAIVGQNRPQRTQPRPAEIASYGSRSVIVVTPVGALKRLAGVQLVPVGNGRALISLGHRSIPQFELDIRDAIARDGIGSTDKATLVAIADILRRARLSRHITLEERTILVLESKRQRP
jgi:hypothetical protein